MSFDPEEQQRLVDDLRMTRKELTDSVDLLMKVTDRLVAVIIQLIRATR